MSNNIVSKLKRKKIEEVIKTGKRMDGRDLLQYRDWQIKTGFLEKPEGSAEVRLGKTHVVVGVKAGIGT
ncbi:MAG: RNA-binding protein, partial [Candidatus Bathyarchaeota archaeon]